MSREDVARKKIEALGGTCAVARLCGVKPPSVCRWRTVFPEWPEKFLDLYVALFRPDLHEAWDFRADVLAMNPKLNRRNHGKRS